MSAETPDLVRVAGARVECPQCDGAIIPEPKPREPRDPHRSRRYRPVCELCGGSGGISKAVEWLLRIADDDAACVEVFAEILAATGDDPPSIKLLATVAGMDSRGELGDAIAAIAHGNR